MRPIRFAKLIVPVALMGFLAVATVSQGPAAQTLCSRPVQPLCSTDIQAADTGPERLRCREDVARYIDNLEDYGRCLEGAVDDADGELAAAREFRACLIAEDQGCSIDTDG